jgi:hypothetical protein
MSGWAEERQILEAWFAGQWATQPLPWNALTVPVIWEGQVTDPPAAGGPYIEMFVMDSPEGTQITLGTPALNRYVAMIQFTISCPIGESAGPNQMARQIADVLDGLWKGRRFQTTHGRIRCRVPGLHTIGNVDERWVAVMTVPYVRDEIAAIPPPVLLPSGRPSGAGLATGAGTLTAVAS